ncbi:MAG: hypothetical protein R3E44_14480 [Paracoccaceae bacterium]
MSNPFKNRVRSLSGPATDIVPVEPDDAAELVQTAIALYVETGGAVTVLTAAGVVRTFNIPDFTFVPVGVRQVHATGTTASGIHALCLS